MSPPITEYSELKKIFRADDSNINYDKQQGYGSVLTLHKHKGTGQPLVVEPL